MIERIARDTAIAAVVMALLGAAWFRNLSVPAGVIGGALLIALSFWAIWGSVEAFLGRR